MRFELLHYVPHFLAVILSLPFHEFSHAYVAKLLGDDTAQKRGRLTINPVRHIDFCGLICLIFLGLGWAKPVPIDINKFSKPKRDIVLVSLAGPVSNLLLALISVLLCKLVLICFCLKCLKLEVMLNVVIILKSFIITNISLAVFNLVPVPPLDGSRVLLCFMIHKTAELIFLENFGSVVLIVLVWSQKLNTIIRVCSFQVFAFFDFLTCGFGLFDDILKLVL